MVDEGAFLEALAEDPDDDATRLVYADWLEEHGAADRALYLRTECELAALPGEGERRTSRQCGQALLLRFRLAQLRKGLDPAWLGSAGKRYDVVVLRAGVPGVVARGLPWPEAERFRRQVLTGAAGHAGLLRPGSVELRLSRPGRGGR